MVELIDESKFAAVMSAVVEPVLKSCSFEGWMNPAEHPGLEKLPAPEDSHDGKLHYVNYRYAVFAKEIKQFDAGYFLPSQAGIAQNRPDEAKATIVILHGFTRNAYVHRELAWYFLNAGYNICCLEHRGHGLSPHDVGDENVVWIDNWRRYVVDAALFCKTVARSFDDGKPLYLYGYSMGGGIGVALAEQYPHLLDKIVLAAPMIEPSLSLGKVLSTVAVKILCAFGQGRKASPGQRKFPEELDKSLYKGLSEPRAVYKFELCKSDRRYHTCQASNEWVNQAAGMAGHLLKKEACEQVITPILLLQAGKDSYVLPKSQEKFIESVSQNGVSAQLSVFDDMRHEFEVSENEQLRPWLERILDFYDTDFEKKEN